MVIYASTDTLDARIQALGEGVAEAFVGVLEGDVGFWHEHAWVEDIDGEDCEENG